MVVVVVVSAGYSSENGCSGLKIVVGTGLTSGGGWAGSEHLKLYQG